MGTFAKAISEMKRSILVIYRGHLGPDKMPKLDSVEGTGFLVGRDGYFVTAAHVVRSLEQYTRGFSSTELKAYAAIPIGGWEQDQYQVRTFEFRPCFIDDDWDVAACKAEPNPFSDINVSNYVRPSQFEPKRPPEGTEVAITGVPTRMNRMFTAIGHVGGYTGFEGEQGPKRMYVSAVGAPGLSGGPVYNADGNVVGIHRASGVGEDSGLSDETPAAAVLRLLTDHGIKH